MPFLEEASVVQPIAPVVATVPVVTPAQGPPSQEPPRPIVLQNALVGAGQTALTNVLTGGMTQAPEILWCAAGLNAVMQGVKNIDWFDEKVWTAWFLLIVGILVLCWYYRDPLHWDLTSLWPWSGHFMETGYLDIPGKGVLQGATSAFQALSNYHGLGATGVSPMQPTAFEHSIEAKRQAVTA